MSIEQDNRRDALRDRQDAIEQARKDTLVAIRNVLDDFATKIGASRTAPADAMGYAEDMLGEITYSPMNEIERQLDELDAEITRDEKP